MANFDRNYAKEEIRLKKDLILTTSIFGREKEDKKIVDLKRKLANMSNDTLNALKIGQGIIKKKAEKTKINMLIKRLNH